jgi:tricorn protease
VSQTGAGTVKKFPLAKDAAYYFDPAWSPDSKLLAFRDNHLRLWMLDTTNGKLTHVGEDDYYQTDKRDISWSPDSKWLAYSQIVKNHLHALFLYSVETGKATQFTQGSADSRLPTFDRGGKYLYFAASTNSGGTSAGLDMTSDLLFPLSNVYALVLAADQTSPIAPESDDEKTPAQAKEKAAGRDLLRRQSRSRLIWTASSRELCRCHCRRGTIWTYRPVRRACCTSGRLREGTGLQIAPQH